MSKINFELKNFESNVTLRIVKDKFGIKLKIITPFYNEKFVKIIKSMNWNEVHWKYNDGWTIDYDKSSFLANILNRNGFVELSKKIMSIAKNEKIDFVNKYNVDCKVDKNGNLIFSSNYNETIVDICHRNGGYWDKTTKKWIILKHNAKNFINDISNTFDNSIKTITIVYGQYSTLTENLDFNKLTIEIEKRAKLYPLSNIKQIYRDFYKDIRKVIGFKHPNERKIRRWSKKDLSDWDGIVFNGKYEWNGKGTLTFDVGYVNDVKQMLTEKGFVVNIVDNRKIFKLSKETNFNIKLWPPQEKALNNIVKQLKNNGSCLYQLPTGLGKTEVSIGVISKLGVKTIILVNSKDLLYQWKNRIKNRINIDAGIIGDGIFQPAEITVATLQSLWNYIKQNKEITSSDISLVEKFIEKGEIEDDFAPIKDEMFESFSLVILDEVHIGAADTFLAVLRSFTSKYFLGQSATTWRTDKMHPLLWSIFGKLNFEYELNSAIDDGYLVRPIVKIVPTKRKYNENNYQSIIKNMKNDDERNYLIAEIVIDAPKPCLVLTNQVTHQSKIRKAFNEYKIFSYFLNGKNTMTERNTVLNKLKEGKTDVVCTTPIWNQGVDIPSLKSVVLAFPTRSDVVLIQKIGRAIRKSPKKYGCTIYDLVDDNPILLDQFSDRAKVYVKYGWLKKREIIQKIQNMRISYYITCPICKNEICINKLQYGTYLKYFTDDYISKLCKKCKINEMQ